MNHLRDILYQSSALWKLNQWLLSNCLLCAYKLPITFLKQNLWLVCSRKHDQYIHMQTHHLRSVWHRQIWDSMDRDLNSHSWYHQTGIKRANTRALEIYILHEVIFPLTLSPWNWLFVFYILYYTESDIWIINQCICLHYLTRLGVLCHGCSDKNKFSSKECGAFHVKNCPHVKDLLCTCWIYVR